MGNSSHSRKSGLRAIVCPECEFGALRSQSPGAAACDSCGHVPDGALLRTLEQIVALPDALGAHACECGHPEMRRLPDSVYRCPACGSEVVPVGAGPKDVEHGEAYWSGWMDGRFREPESMAHNKRLARWEEAHDRLDFYRGHRAGQEARAKRSGKITGLS